MPPPSSDSANSPLALVADGFGGSTIVPNIRGGCVVAQKSSCLRVYSAFRRLVILTFPSHNHCVLRKGIRHDELGHHFHRPHRFGLRQRPRRFSKRKTPAIASRRRTKPTVRPRPKHWGDFLKNARIRRYGSSTPPRRQRHRRRLHRHAAPAAPPLDRPAAEAGKHILVEKPHGLNHAEAMIAVERRPQAQRLPHGSVHVPLPPDRNHRNHQTLCGADAIGQVRALQANFAYTLPPRPTTKPAPSKIPSAAAASSTSAAIPPRSPASPPEPPSD